LSKPYIAGEKNLLANRAKGGREMVSNRCPLDCSKRGACTTAPVRKKKSLQRHRGREKGGAEEDSKEKKVRVSSVCKQKKKI